MEQMKTSKLKFREDCQLNLEKLKQHCKKEVKVLKEVSSNPHCSRYVQIDKLSPKNPCSCSGLLQGSQLALG